MKNANVEGRLLPSIVKIVSSFNIAVNGVTEVTLSPLLISRSFSNLYEYFREATSLLFVFNT